MNHVTTHKLNLYTTESIDQLDTPETPPQIDIDSPALTVFTDFHQVAPVTVEPDVSIAELNGLMIAAHVRLMLVTEPPGRCIGVIGLDDISQQNVIREVSRGFSRSELTARDFMRPRDSLKCFRYRELHEASIRDVIAALEDSGEQHCLVVDREAQRIRGIISASDIARTLRVPVRLDRMPSFARICAALAHQLGEPAEVVGFR